jgi:hypothetical protein
VYSTVGYVIAIISVLSFCILPRAKFLQTMMLNVVSLSPLFLCFGFAKHKRLKIGEIGTCIAAAMSLLASYCIIKARQNTAQAADSEDPTLYNSSASAVWLFFNVWMANMIRVASPNFNSPAILYTIFLVVTSTFAPQWPAMIFAISFAVRLLKAFLTGLGLATGVNLFFFPVSSRDIIFRETATYLRATRHALTCQATWRQLEPYIWG